MTNETKQCLGFVLLLPGFFVVLWVLLTVLPG